MKAILENYCRRMDMFTRWTGSILCYLIMIIMFLVSLEVILRYFFNRPTVWAWPVSNQLFGFFILIAGTYAMFQSRHIRIDFIIERFPRRLRRIAQYVNIAAIIVFLGVLIWQGTWMGWNALSILETDSTAFGMPLFPLKVLIPIGALHFLLQSIADFIRNKI